MIPTRGASRAATRDAAPPAGDQPGNPLLKLLPRLPEAILLALTAIYVLEVVAVLPIQYIANAAHDDALFVRLAESIKAGHWLGTYNNVTLAKGPGLSLWIAITTSLWLPLRLSEFGLYLAATWVLVRALRLIGWASWPLLALSAALVLHPVMIVSLGRVGREAIYTPLTLLVLALLTLHIAVRDAPLKRRIACAAGLGAALAYFWITREEGLWVVPGLALGLVGVVALGWAAGARGWPWVGREMLVMITIGAVSVLSVLCVAMVNKAYYGVARIVEFKDRAFLDAYGALQRIQHDHWRQHLLVPQEVLHRAYEVSSALRETQPAFEGPVLGWTGHGCLAYAITPCDGEY